MHYIFISTFIIKWNLEKDALLETKAWAIKITKTLYKHDQRTAQLLQNIANIKNKTNWDH